MNRGDWAAPQKPIVLAELERCADELRAAREILETTRLMSQIEYAKVAVIEEMLLREGVCLVPLPPMPVMRAKRGAPLNDAAKGEATS